MFDQIRNHYYHFLEQLGDAVIITDQRHRVLYMNQKAVEITGFNKDELLEERLLDHLQIIDNAGTDICHNVLRPVMLKKTPTGLQEGTKLCFGNRNCFYSSASITPWEHEGEDGIIWTFRDITRVVNRTLELKDQFDELKVFKTIFDESQTIIMLLDLNGRFVKANKAAELRYGYTREEFAEISVEEIRQDPNVLLEIRDKNRVHQKKIKSVHFTKSGEAFPVEIFSRYINLQGENYLLGMVKDISAEQEQRRKLRQEKKKAEDANAAKSEFLSNMSHEVRTPISGIMGMTELLLKDELNKDQVENLKIIKRSSENLLNILNDVLDYSKIEAGHLSLNNAPFSLEEFVENIRKNYQRVAKEKNLRFEVLNSVQTKKELYGDVNRLYQIINNLVFNAFKFTNQGAVSFSVEAVEEKEKQIKLNFLVKDTGAGINKAKVPELFQPFVQEDTAYHLRKGGAGLGLSIVKQLVDLMGGTVGVKSEKYEGSLFWVTLEFDLVDQHTSVSNTEPDFENLKGRRILLVEDFSINQRMVVSFLKPYGMEVTIAKDGKEATDKFQQEIYDLILMDIQMPVMDGIEATKWIRNFEEKQNLSPTPIIALTAYALKGDREKFMDMGMNSYLSKPYRKDELLSIIDEQLRIDGSKDNLLEYLKNRTTEGEAGVAEELESGKIEDVQHFIQQLGKAMEKIEEESLENLGRDLRDFGKAEKIAFVEEWAFKFLLAIRRKDFTKGDNLLRDFRKRVEEVRHENFSRGR